MIVVPQPAEFVEAAQQVISDPIFWVRSWSKSLSEDSPSVSDYRFSGEEISVSDIFLWIGEQSIELWEVYLETADHVRDGSDNWTQVTAMTRIASTFNQSGEVIKVRAFG